MTIRKPRAKQTRRATPPACAEHERVIETLRRQVLTLEQDRDAIRQGFEELTRALRHRGCCDGIDQPHRRT